MKTKTLLLIAAGLAAVAGIVLLLRKKAAAAKVDAKLGGTQAATQGVFAGNTSGAIAALQAMPSSPAVSFKQQAIGGYAALAGAGATAACQKYTGGSLGSMCNTVGALQTQVTNKVVGLQVAAAQKVGGYAVSGTKKVGSAIGGAASKLKFW